MKGWKWSNGETVDASDVVFWLNMMKAEPANYYGYVPGLLPDNLASYSATDANTIRTFSYSAPLLRKMENRRMEKERLADVYAAGEQPIPGVNRAE